MRLKPQTRDSRHMGEIRSKSVEGLVRDPLLRHVLDGTRVLDLSRAAPSAASNDVNESKLAARPLEPNVRFQIAAVAASAVDSVVEGRSVFGMHSTGYQGERDVGATIDPENPIRLIGPCLISSVSTRHVKLPVKLRRCASAN